MHLNPVTALRGGFSLLSLAFFLLAGLSSADAQTRNTTPLSALQGNFRGQVLIGGTSLNRELKGKDTLRFQAKNGDLRGQLRVKGFVRVDDDQVPVDNLFVFAPSGKLKVEEIAPGVTDRQKADGTYTATATVITFQAPFESGTSAGLISGTLTVESKAKRTNLTLQYSITLDGGEPLYIYTYSGSRKVGGGGKKSN